MVAPTAQALSEALRPLTEDPTRAAVFLDVDGTLAPIVGRAEDARVPEATSRLLGVLGRRYATVACVSGRSAAEARRLVGVGSIAYAGMHGAELVAPGESSARFIPEVSAHASAVRRFMTDHDGASLRLLRIRTEDKGPIVAFPWRGVPDEQAAVRHLEAFAADAESAGLATHWGRKVLEVRPPVPVHKGSAVRDLVERTRVDAALFAGDDTTDLDGFAALDELLAEGALMSAVRVGVSSDDGPPAIPERADLVVDGVPGFAAVLEALAEA
ncbi:MAG: trehalose-phosphatase [Acidimicrobiales bacterium]